MKIKIVKVEISRFKMNPSIVFYKVIIQVLTIFFSTFNISLILWSSLFIKIKRN